MPPDMAAEGIILGPAIAGDSPAQTLRVVRRSSRTACFSESHSLHLYRDYRFRPGCFFGNEEANPTPRATHVRSVVSVRYPAGATSSQPAMARAPARSNGFAPGSFNIVSVVEGSIRTMRSSP